MSETLKILHLEDLQDDAELIRREMVKAGINCEVHLVENKKEFIKELNRFMPDIILSDHSLAAFDSLEALSLVKQMGIEAPFILVTATVSEEYAVSIIREGAADYILKDRLQRLPSAVLNAIKKHRLELEKKKAYEALQASRRKYKLLFESNPMPMWMIAKSTLRVIAVNEAALLHYGYTREEFLSLTSLELRPEDEVEKYLGFINNETPGISKRGIWKHKKKDGTIMLIDLIAHDVLYENQPARLFLANDVTEKILAEEELARQRHIQQKLITETGIKAQEREREMIGRELHDNINQILAASKFYLSHALKKEIPDPQSLKKTNEYISLAINEIRKLTHELIAPALDDIPLILAIDGLLKEITLITNVQTKLNAENFSEANLSNDKKLMLYRVIQEQVNNILKHAHAKNIMVQLLELSEQVLLSIADDGLGFDPDKKTEGIGLRNIRNRVGFFDGTVRIITAPGNGCTLEVRIPVKDSA
jgi:two-component system sensor histidine kinase UhpB